MARKKSLPVLQPAAPARTLAASRAGKWRTAVLLLVHLAIAAHIAHWLTTGRTVTPVEPSEAMAYSKAGIVNAGLIFFAATIALTAVFGRWFCGWACHLAALQDGSLWLLKRLGIRPKPLRSRLLAWVPVVAFVYMFLWPAAWRLFHGDRLGVRGTEFTTSEFWATFPGWIVGGLTFLVCGFVTVYFLGAKGFCTYACPYGAAFGFVDRLAPMRIRVTDACEQCGHCTAVCTSNVRVHEEVAAYGMVVDAGCMKCLDCVSVCPNDALYFGAGKLPLFAKAPGPEPESKRYPLSWGEELFAAAAFAAAFFSWRGLFGYVPFLMALGLAGGLAFVALEGFRLARRPSLAFRHRTLKRDGKLLAAGRAAWAGIALLGLLTAYAGTLQFTVRGAQRRFAELDAVRARALDLSATASPIVAESERSALAAAATGYRRVARLSPFGWLGLDSRRAWTAYLSGDRPGFLESASRALVRGDATGEMRRLWAADAADHGQGDAAATAIEAAPEAGETAWVDLVRRAGARDDLATAGLLANRGLARFPGSAALNYNAGVVAALQNQPDRASELFRRTLAVDPGHREARENLAGMLAEAGRFEEALAAYRDAIGRSPEDLDLRLLFARALEGAGRRDEALAVLRSIPESAPQSGAAKSLEALWTGGN